MTGSRVLVTLEQAKRDCILVAAAKAFAQRGFRKASVDEIAKSAGVAKGTVYLACESKEDLFYQAVHREIREWTATCARLIDPRKPADELLLQVALENIAEVGKRPLVLELFEGKYAELLPRWMKEFEELRALGRKNVEEIIELGITQGRFRRDIDVHETAILLQDLNLSTIVFRPYRTDFDLSRRIRAGLDLVLNGLRNPDTKGPLPEAP
ncbi:MAG: TetR/AcrR family transcriptional regulator [Polyangiaceae bacterium]